MDKKREFLRIFTGTLIILNLLSYSATAQDEYTVSILSIPSKQVQIKATLHPSNDTILMSPYGATHLENGWAAFISNLVAINKYHKQIAIISIGGGQFVFFPFIKGEELYLSYTVNITHQKEKWPFGYKEAAYINKDILVATGNALFITRLDMQEATVKFILPKSYKVTTAWRKTAPNLFKVQSPTELVWTVLAVGIYNKTEIIAGETTIQLVYSKELNNVKLLMVSTLTAAVKRYKEIFGGNPVNSSTTSGKFVCVINVDSSYIGGGAAFTNSISILLNKPPTANYKASTTSWSHILIHEIGHLWNGQSLKTEEQNEWFTEGVTDYITYKIEFAMGLLGKAEWESMMKLKQKNYHEAFKGVSLKNAGEDKSSNYNLIYSGGLLFANMLDEEIKKSTQNKKNLNSFLRNFYQEFALKGKTFVSHDIIDVFEKTCLCNSDTIFDNLTATKTMVNK